MISLSAVCRSKTDFAGTGGDPEAVPTGKEGDARTQLGAMRIEPAFLFDLDGTLVDSVSRHVRAWQKPLDAEGIELSVWRMRTRPTF
jgi:hypothetical protein